MSDLRCMLELLLFFFVTDSRSKVGRKVDRLKKFIFSAAMELEVDWTGLGASSFFRRVFTRASTRQMNLRILFAPCLAPIHPMFNS